MDDNFFVGSNIGEYLLSPLLRLSKFIAQEGRSALSNAVSLDKKAQPTGYTILSVIRDFPFAFL